jgi:acyl-CoA dehydrogenase
MAGSSVDISFTSEERLIRDTVHSFVTNELLPYEQAVLRRALDGGHPELNRPEERELQAKAQSSGLWGIDLPAEYGGADLSHVAIAITNMELGRSFLDFQFGGHISPSFLLMNEDQKQRYLPPLLDGSRTHCFALSEPGVGSDAHGLKTTARRSGPDWVINGEKHWISRGNHADLALVFAKTPDEGTDPEAVTLFLVEREWGWTSSPIPVMGTMECASLSFVDVPCPDANRIGPVGGGLALAMRQLHRARAVFLPARDAGACERMLSMAIAHAKQRTTFGKPLSERENIQWMIADAEVDIRAAKLLTFAAACEADRGADYRHAACVAKLYGAQMANRVVDTVLQIHGASGYSEELPISRWYRNMRVHRIYEGSDEMNRMAIQRNLLRGYTEVAAVAQ